MGVCGGVKHHPFCVLMGTKKSSLLFEIDMGILFVQDTNGLQGVTSNLERDRKTVNRGKKSFFVNRQWPKINSTSKSIEILRWKSVRHFLQRRKQIVVLSFPKDSSDANGLPIQTVNSAMIHSLIRTVTRSTANHNKKTLDGTLFVGQLSPNNRPIAMQRSGGANYL